MDKIIFPVPLKFFVQSILVISVLCLALGPAGASPAAAGTQSNQDSCGQLLADAEARFMAALAPDGSVPATPETREAALEYIRVSKLCYEEVEAQNSVGSLQGEIPEFIDDGGVHLENESSAEFVSTNKKWGSSTPGTSGGTITYSFMGTGYDLSQEPNSADYGNSVALSSLPGFQACFITEIQNAFAAWQAVANIRFVQVTDSGSAFNASNASGDIRIGAHYFDGPSGTLAHAYYPPPNGTSGAGDMHFDSSESWTCNTSGVDIGVVALHEIGHSLGLGHEDQSSITAIMDPYYNPYLAGLQSDDVNGAVAIYGPAELLAPPSNDNFAGAKTVGSIPYTDSISVLDATVEASEPTVNSMCDGKLLFRGNNTVWYKYTPGTSRVVSMDTIGSSYDTYIAVWTGVSLGSLTLRGCDDDTSTGLTSQLSISLTAGTTYYIQIAKYNGTQSLPGDNTPCNPCNLSFHVKSQTFADVPPSHPYFQYIEALYAAGLTGGCATNPLRYCPATILDRAQMAVFSLRGEFGVGYTPPPPPWDKFADDWTPGPWAERWAEGMLAAGLTGGCTVSPLRYCPWTLTTRQEAAVFAMRLQEGSNYSPPPATGTVFADMTNTSFYATKWAEAAYANGLIPACGTSGGKPLFCPTALVDRGLGAFIIAQAKGLVP